MLFCRYSYWLHGLGYTEHFLCSLVLGNLFLFVFLYIFEKNGKIHQDKCIGKCRVYIVCIYICMFIVQSRLTSNSKSSFYCGNLSILYQQLTSIRACVIEPMRQQTFSPQQTRALFAQPTIGCLLNGSPYGHLHIKQQPCCTVNCTQIYRAIQWVYCLPVYSLLIVPFIYCHKTRQGM